MKKLGICVCYQHRNYGSQLQSYATTVELKKRNIDFEIIRYKKKITPLLLAKSLPRLFNPVFVRDRILLRYQKNLMMKLKPELGKSNAVRNKCFADFSAQRFTDLSPVYYGYDNLKKAGSEYKAVMVGSDQLWGPGGITSNFYNLMFASDNTRKISFSASFGVSQIKPGLHDLYRRFLNRMDYISVREITGKNLVEQLSHKTAQVVVDPVMLLTAEEWLEEIPNDNRYKEPYIFAYFLGESAEHRKAVTEFARKKGLKIVTSHHTDKYNKADEGFGDYAPFDIGPAEFVNLIRNAEYVFTDSFHGSVFSVLYQKKFLIFTRYSDKSITSKNSRIDSFCQIFSVEDRRYQGKIEVVDNYIDYTVVLEKVQQEREKSKAFLDKALKNLSRGD